jgi:hypothetical protein
MIENRYDIFGHIMTEFIRAEKGFYRTGMQVNDDIINGQRPRASPWSLILVLRDAAEPQVVNLGGLMEVAGSPLAASGGNQFRAPSASVSSSSGIGGAVNYVPPPGSPQPTVAIVSVSPAIPMSSPNLTNNYSSPSSSPSPPPAVAQNAASAGSTSGYAPAFNPFGTPTTATSSSTGIGGYNSPGSPVAASAVVTPSVSPSLPQPVVYISGSNDGGIGGAGGSRRSSLNPFDDGWNTPEGQPHNVFGSSTVVPVHSPVATTIPTVAAVPTATPPGGAQFGNTTMYGNGIMPAPSTATAAVSLPSSASTFRHVAAVPAPAPQAANPHEVLSLLHKLNLCSPSFLVCVVSIIP